MPLCGMARRSLDLATMARSSASCRLTLRLQLRLVKRSATPSAHASPVHHAKGSLMNTSPSKSSRWRSPAGIFMLVAGAVGLYYLLTEHLTHVTQAIPYVVLLACPLMHLFGRR